MIKKIISLLLTLISGYFVLRNIYLGINLIILMASSIYFGYSIKEGKGKTEAEGSHFPQPQPLNISIPKGYGDYREYNEK